MFANIVAELASKFKDAAGFVNALRDKFTQDKDIPNWGSGGFKPQFKDDVGPGRSPNQVRHYVGGLWAGFLLGIAGNWAANMREQPGPDFSDAKPWQNNPVPKLGKHTPSELADIALNGVATAHGKGLMMGRLKPSDIADRIRADVCEL